MVGFKPIPGETPIDPSGLRDKSIKTRRQLNEDESRNIADAVYKYLIDTLTPKWLRSIWLTDRCAMKETFLSVKSGHRNHDIIPT